MAVEHVKKDGDILAIILRAEFSEPGVHFVTPDEYNLQLGVHLRKAGVEIPAHVHKEITGVINLPIQEFLYITEGRVKIDLYDKKDDYYKSVELGPGDSILLLRGHNLVFLEDSKIIEIKQGPYYSVEKDKKPIRGKEK